MRLIEVHSKSCKCNATAAVDGRIAAPIKVKGNLA